MAIEDINKGRLTWWLWEAMLASDLPAAHKWITMGADIWAPIRTGHSGSIVQKMVVGGEVDKVRLLLDSGRVPKGDARVSDLLHTAICSGNLEMSRLLLEWGGKTKEGLIIDLATNHSSLPKELFVMLLRQETSYSANARGNEMLVRKCLSEFDPEFIGLLIERDLELELREMVSSAQSSNSGILLFRQYFAALDARSKAKLLLAEASETPDSTVDPAP